MVALLLSASSGLTVPSDQISIRNFGEKSLDELKERLAEKGYLDEAGEEEMEPEAAVVVA